MGHFDNLTLSADLVSLAIAGRCNVYKTGVLCNKCRALRRRERAPNDQDGEY